MGLLPNAQMAVAAAPGTGAAALAAATPGAQTWSAAGAQDGAAYSYRIEEGAAWEIGTGTYDASVPRLVRTSFLASSTGAPVAFGPAAIVSQIVLPADLAAALAPYIVAESLGETGYRKWSDGWIEQWGYVPAAGDVQVTFPLAFPTKHLGAVVSPDAGDQAATTVLAVWYAKLSLSQMNILNRYSSQGSSGQAAAPFSWRAWGY